MKVIPGELASVTNLIGGFLQDLTPDPNDIEDVNVNPQVLNSLMALASSFTPKNDGEAMELAYVIDTLRGMKEGT